MDRPCAVVTSKAHSIQTEDFREIELGSNRSQIGSIPENRLHKLTAEGEINEKYEERNTKLKITHSKITPRGGGRETGIIG